MSPNEIFNVMRDVLAKDFEISGEMVRPESRLVDDLDLDSLDAVTLVVELGDAVGLDLDDNDFRDCVTLGDVARVVGEQVASGD